MKEPYLEPYYKQTQLKSKRFASHLAHTALRQRDREVHYISPAPHAPARHAPFLPHALSPGGRGSQAAAP